MQASRRIAIDAMGGDSGAAVTVPAACDALAAWPDLELVLVGDERLLQARLDLAGPAVRSRLHLHHAPGQISDQDKPETVLRKSQDSSMYQAVELVRTGVVAAAVSAGNTGALLMIGRHLLKTLPGIQKPAIVATIPGASRQCLLLDVGANPDCSAQQLFEFAVMGSVLAESLRGARARVGLLNIGAEQHKGTEEVKEAAMKLEQCSEIDYIGFVEANELYQGVADVVVCDGYVGNVTIKTSAGVANVVRGLMEAQIKRNWLTRLSALFAGAVLNPMLAQINPHRFNGASLLGLQGSIVKSHGNATKEGFYYAIAQALLEVEHVVPQLIAARVAAIMASN
ncbi:MAG: phosphate acyltransferase PlsX [Gammaproteobacteria bacterium]